jgi:hypothetical protein
MLIEQRKQNIQSMLDCVSVVQNVPEIVLYHVLAELLNNRISLMKPCVLLVVLVMMRAQLAQSLNLRRL